MLDRFAAAGLLHKHVDAARVRHGMRWHRRVRRAPHPVLNATTAATARFRLSQGCLRVERLKQVLQALATAGHESLAVDIAVHGRCAECAHPT